MMMMTRKKPHAPSQSRSPNAATSLSSWVGTRVRLAHEAMRARWAQVREIWLSSNKLVGQLPASLSQLSSLRFLGLEGNGLSGFLT